MIDQVKYPKRINPIPKGGYSASPMFGKALGAIGKTIAGGIGAVGKLLKRKNKPKKVLL